MAKRRSNSRHEKSIDIIRWAGGVHTFNAVSAGSNAQVAVTDGATETILRIRGEVLAYIDATSAPGKLMDVAIGMLVVQAGSSTTVIQSPIADPDAPWLFYERFTIGYEEMVTDVVDVPGIVSKRIVVDSKAMRILRPGREVQLVMQSSTLFTTSAVNLAFSFRMLLGSH